MKHTGILLCYFLILIWLPKLLYCQTTNLANSPAFTHPHEELRFVENRGQIADQNGSPMPEVLYSIESNGTTCYLTASGMHFVFRKLISSNSSENDPIPIERTLQRQGRFRDTLILQRLDLGFVAPNRGMKIEALDLKDGYYNFYLAHCHLSQVPSYGKIIYHDIYPNIDLIVYGAGSDVKYDYVVHPGGDPERIKMKFGGQDSIIFSMAGGISVCTQFGRLDEDKPFSYQYSSSTDEESRVEVPSRFRIKSNELQFDLGKFDHRKDLIIDPIRRLWGTYFGGAVVSDLGKSPIVNRSNSIAFCGETYSTSGIATAGAYQTSLGGAQDVFLAKFDPTGALLWATYFGGDKNEFSGGLALDSVGNYVLYGETESTTGIATPLSHQTTLQGPNDAFLAKFTNSGSLVWSTYFGGDATESVTGSRCVSIDRGGHIYITGSTTSNNGLATPNAFQTVHLGTSNDAFLARFNSDDTLQWATYYGTIGDDYGTAIAIDNNGSVYFGGYTQSTTGIATTTGFQSVYGGGIYDGFFAKFDASVGRLNWGTYFGGPKDDYLVGLCTDTAGNIYGCGFTNSATSIASNGAYQSSLGAVNDYDAFLFRFTPSGARTWSTYYGGERPDFSEDIVITPEKLLVAGHTSSKTGISSVDAYQPTITSYFVNGTLFATYEEAFLSRFSFLGQRIWGTYYGGEFTDNGLGCALDNDGNPILTGSTLSTTNIASPGAYKTSGPTGTPGTNVDAFLVKFCDIPIPVLTLSKDTICAEGFDTLKVTTGYDHFYWFDGSTPIPSLTDSTIYIPSNSTLAVGSHAISVLVDKGGCDATSDTVKFIVRAAPVADAGNDTAICVGSSIKLAGKALGGITPYKYLWTPSTSLSDPRSANPIAMPLVTTTYYFTVTDNGGCVGEDSVIIKINPPPKIDPRLFDTVCLGKSIIIGDTARAGKPPFIYDWAPKTGLNLSFVPTPVASPTKTTTYTETVTDSNGCQTKATILVTVVPPPNPVIEGPSSVCIQQTALYTLKNLSANSTSIWYLDGGGTISKMSDPDSITVLWNVAGSWVLTVSDTNAQGCSKDTSFKITVGTSLTPVITPGPTVSYCAGDSVVLFAKGYASYKWSDGSTADSLTVKSAGNYSVTVTSAGGCSGTSTDVVVTENPSPNVVITPDGPTHLCSGSTVGLSAPSGLASYAWSTGETTASITVSAAGTYTVQATNSYGCTGISQPITIIIDATLTPTITPSGPLSFCEGDSVTLDAGDGFATYEWYKDGGVIGSSRKITVGQSGSYSATVTSGSCKGTSIPTVVVVYPIPPQPIITRSGTTLVSTPAASYQWFLNGVIVSGQTNQSILITANGDYTVIITDANGCSNISVPFTFVRQGSATAIVSIGQITPMNPGASFEIPIVLSASSNLNSSNANHYVGIIRYDGSMIVPTTSRNGTLHQSQSVTGSNERTVQFEGYSSPITTGVLQWIECDATLGDDSCTAIVIDTFYWTDATVTVTRVSGEFCETGLCYADGKVRLLNASGTFGLSPIQPNPASSHIRITFDLIESGRTQIELIDMMGRLTKRLADDDMKAGHYTIDVPLEATSSGCYQVRLKSPSQSLHKILIVQR